MGKKNSSTVVKVKSMDEAVDLKMADAKAKSKKNNWMAADVVVAKAMEAETFKHMTKDFLERTSAHGLPKVATSGSILRRVIWVSIFLLALGYFCYQVSQLFDQYFDFPVGVRTTVSKRNKVDFPAVTLCNINMLKKSKVRDDPRYVGLADIDDEIQVEIEKLLGGNRESYYQWQGWYDYDWYDYYGGYYGSGDYDHYNYMYDYGEGSGDESSGSIDEVYSTTESPTGSDESSGSTDEVYSTTESLTGKRRKRRVDINSIPEQEGFIPLGPPRGDDQREQRQERKKILNHQRMKGMNIRRNKPGKDFAGFQAPHEKRDGLNTDRRKKAGNMKLKYKNKPHRPLDEEIINAIYKATEDPEPKPQRPNGKIPMRKSPTMRAKLMRAMSKNSEEVFKSSILNPSGAKRGERPLERKKRNPKRRRKRVAEVGSDGAPPKELGREKRGSYNYDYYDDYYDYDYNWWYDDYYYDGEYDWGYWYNQYYTDYGWSDDSDNDFAFEAFMNYSVTPDYSDLVDLLKPTEGDLDDYGYSAEDLIIQCSFDKEACTTDDFKLVRNSYYGNCFTFNSGDANDNDTVRTTTKYGSRYGLRLTLDIDYDEYLGLFSHMVGTRITIHPHNVTAFPEDYGVSAAPGKETGIGIRLEKILREEWPHPSNCTWGEQTELDYDGVYTVLACSMTCLQRRLFDECGCVDKKITVDNNTRCAITNSTQEKCRQKIYHMFNEEKLGCDCPPACQELNYKTSVSSSDWPSDPYSFLLVKKLLEEDKKKRENAASDEEDTHFYDAISNAYSSDGNFMDQVQKNYVRVHVYLEDPNVISIEEFTSYPWDRLVADIGGLLGLFIGVSLCTALEFLEYIIDVMVFLTKRFRKNKVKPTHPVIL